MFLIVGNPGFTSSTVSTCEEVLMRRLLAILSWAFKQSGRKKYKLLFHYGSLDGKKY